MRSLLDLLFIQGHQRDNSYTYSNPAYGPPGPISDIVNSLSCSDTLSPLSELNFLSASGPMIGLQGCSSHDRDDPRWIGKLAFCQPCEPDCSLVALALAISRLDCTQAYVVISQRGRDRFINITHLLKHRYLSPVY